MCTQAGACMCVCVIYAIIMCMQVHVCAYYVHVYAIICLCRCMYVYFISLLYRRKTSIMMNTRIRHRLSWNRCPRELPIIDQAYSLCSILTLLFFTSLVYHHYRSPVPSSLSLLDSLNSTQLTHVRVYICCARAVQYYQRQ